MIIKLRRGFALLFLANIIRITPVAAAQDTDWSLEPRPSIVATANMVPTTGVAESGQDYGYRDAGLRFAVPLIGSSGGDGGGPSKFRLLGLGGFKADSAILPYMIGRQNLYAADVGLSGIHLVNPKLLLNWSLTSGFADESSVISSPKIKLTGDVVANYRWSDSLTLLFGGGYSFLYGRGRPLPVFGFLWRPRPGTMVSVMGPLSGHVRQRLTPWLMVGAQGGLHGNQYHIPNNAQFSSPTNDLYLQYREVRAGGQMGFRLNRSLALFGEGGMAAARTLTYADGKTKLSSLAVGAQPYVTISLRYFFSKRSRWDDFGSETVGGRK